MRLLTSRARLLGYAEKALALLPRQLDPALAGVVGLVAFLAKPEQRRVVADNQSIARSRTTTGLFGRARAGLWSLAAHYFYARYWVDMLRLPRLTPRDIAQAVDTVDALTFAARRRRGQPMIMVLAHVGNWEWGGAWASLTLGGLTTVAERLEDAEMTDWFLRQRRALGMDIVLTGSDSLRPLLRALRDGRLVALLVDRDLTGTGEVVEFLGRPVRMPIGPAILAAATGAPIVPVAAYQAPHGRVRIEFLPEILPQAALDRRIEVTRLTQRVADAVADIIRSAPAQWHNFQPLSESLP